MSVVDIGAIRYFDGRAIAREAWMGYAPFDAALAGERRREPANAYVWVLPAHAAELLDALGDAAATVLFARFTGTPTERILGGPTFVCVDRAGWRPSPSLEAAAAATGVQIALELPTLVEPGTTRTTRELLDRALRGIT
jgi:hypothetical protein